VILLILLLVYISGTCIAVSLLLSSLWFSSNVCNADMNVVHADDHT